MPAAVLETALVSLRARRHDKIVLFVGLMSWKISELPGYLCVGGSQASDWQHPTTPVLPMLHFTGSYPTVATGCSQESNVGPPVDTEEWTQATAPYSWLPAARPTQRAPHAVSTSELEADCVAPDILNRAYAIRQPLSTAGMHVTLLKMCSEHL